MKVICYLPAGYPTIDKTLEIADLYVEGGCDIIEWSIPPINPYIDPPYIAEKMLEARKKCNNLDKYLELIKVFKEKHPDKIVCPLIYKETLHEISIEKFGVFCKKLEIDTIISANITDYCDKEKLLKYGINIAPWVSFAMEDAMIKEALETKSFIYMQAMLNEEDKKAGLDDSTLSKCINKLREIGIDNPIYCGVGIRTTDDVKFLKKSKAQGFFLGSSLIKHYDSPSDLIKTIKEFKQAVI